MLEAGKYFLNKQHLDTHVSEKKIIEFAVQSLKLSHPSTFEPEKRIIEYLLNDINLTN
jgi:glutamate formiminotransferase / formiminotetrahydrofolate cyclodeaminase